MCQADTDFGGPRGLCSLPPAEKIMKRGKLKGEKGTKTGEKSEHKPVVKINLTSNPKKRLKAKLGATLCKKQLSCKALMLLHRSVDMNLRNQWSTSKGRRGKNSTRELQ